MSIATTQPIAGAAAAEDAAAEELTPPGPDQDGPHDVPDDQVIEKTLPSPPAS